MQKFKWKTTIILTLTLSLFIIQGCSLATKGRAIDETKDELIGAWVVLEQSPFGGEINLEEFKNDDAHVLYLDSKIEDERQYIGTKSTGHVYGGDIKMHIGESSGTNVIGEVYFTSTSPNTVKLLPVYEKSNGEQYVIDDITWMVINYDDGYLYEESSNEERSLGAMTLTNTSSKVIDGKEVENTTTMEVNFLKKRDLEEVKLIHLDENFDIISEEEIDLNELKNQVEPIQFNVDSDAQMVMVEETYKSAKENTPYIMREIYSYIPSEEVTHDLFLPLKNDLAKRATIEFIFAN